MGVLQFIYTNVCIVQVVDLEQVSLSYCWPCALTFQSPFLQTLNDTTWHSMCKHAL